MSLRLKMQTLSLLSIALITAVWLPAWIALGGSPDASAARGLVLWSGLAASAVVAVAGAFTGMGLAGRVDKILQVFAKAEDGGLDARYDASSSDEVDRIGRELNVLLERFQGLLAKAAEHEAEAAENARQCRMAMDHAALSRQRAENSRRQGMTGASGTLKRAVGEIQDVAASLSAEVDSTSAGARRQADMVEQTALAVGQLDLAVMEAARNASGAAGLAGRARERAERGAAVVEGVVASITGAQARTMELKGVVEELGGRAESIGRIMTVISDIADQTNLLALNAAIEAARAGEAGRGFAVVADEVRKLAEKTMQATSEVGQVIAAIQNGARGAVTGMEGAAAEVERATSQARQSGEALREIVDIVEETAGQVRSIAAAAEQQSAASTQIGRTVSMVREISGVALDGMARCEQGLDTLIEQVRALANLNRVFTLLGQGTVQELIENMASSPELASLDRGRIEAALRSAVAANPYLELAYVTDGRGRQIVNNIAPAGFAAAYEGTGFGKDWSARPWFAGAMKSGDIFISEVYVSTASGQPCITVSRPIGEVGGGALGVLGLDVKIN